VKLDEEKLVNMNLLLMRQLLENGQELGAELKIDLTRVEDKCNFSLLLSVVKYFKYLL
jgi:hypothetical protein